MATVHVTSRNILDLPLEIFQHILHEMIQARGISRGVRLRLVNRFFSRQVLEVCFLYNMLDKRLSRLSSKLLPIFTASYLEHRVRNEKKGGNPILLYIRKVAEDLASDSQTTQVYIASLSTQAVRHIWRILWPQPSQRLLSRLGIDSEVDFQNHLQTARRFLGCVPDPDLQCYKSTIFGMWPTEATYFESKDRLEQFMASSVQKNRRMALYMAANLGRADMIQFIFNYRVDIWPWCFIEHWIGEWRDDDKQVLRTSLGITPSPEIWNYIIHLYRQQDLPTFELQWQNEHLAHCAKEGWVDMARHLLEIGTDPNAHREGDDTAICIAVKNKKYGLVELLLKKGATIQDGVMEAAASSGHLNMVSLLLSHEPCLTGAVAAAARGGYGDIVELLLKHGGNANENDRELPAIGYAILEEHTTMFRCLVQYGAEAPTSEIRDVLVKKATDAGVESMLALLDSWGTTECRQ